MRLKNSFDLNERLNLSCLSGNSYAGFNALRSLTYGYENKTPSVLRHKRIIIKTNYTLMKFF
jgi:hypothetical protein